MFDDADLFYVLLHDRHRLGAARQNRSVSEAFALKSKRDELELIVFVPESTLQPSCLSMTFPFLNILIPFLCLLFIYSNFSHRQYKQRYRESVYTVSPKNQIYFDLKVRARGSERERDYCSIYIKEAYNDVPLYEMLRTKHC